MENVSTARAPLSLYEGSIWRRVLRFILDRDAAFRQSRAYDQLDDHLRRDLGLMDGHTVARDPETAALLRP